jgi:aspartyl-tRNA(Asn)/glutamyl-tRNA(Gln) amidotransferase subunit B
MSTQVAYETVIGLEIHVQLNTHSKAFCPDAVQAGAPPNTLISTISLAHPGTLPRANKQHIAAAVKLGLATNCTINPKSYFDRKQYFYADLPKGYQITQDNAPICTQGYVTIQIGNTSKKIRINRIHMEEDAGKSNHDIHPQYSLVDLNRAGVPLLEIVSEPDLRSADEVSAYIAEVRQLVRYLQISNANMEDGELRCDCNVSVRLQGTTEYGKRCEIKNVNSLRFARQAVNYEAQRQIKILQNGGSIIQSTLDFNPETGITTPTRSKEDAQDYRYFPDPDLPPVVLTQEYIRNIQAQMPPLPRQLMAQFTEQYKLTPYDATQLTDELPIAQYYIQTINHTAHYKTAANWIINIIKAKLNETNTPIEKFPLTPIHLAQIVELLENGHINNTLAVNQLLPACLQNPTVQPQTLAQQLNLLQSPNNNQPDPSIYNHIDQIFAKYPDKVQEYKQGKKNLIGLFMGELMKATNGRIDPKLANQMLLEKLK